MPRTNGAPGPLSSPYHQSTSEVTKDAPHRTVANVAPRTILKKSAESASLAIVIVRSFFVTARARQS